MYSQSIKSFASFLRNYWICCVPW